MNNYLSMKIGTNQLELISKAKYYCENNLKNNIDVHDGGIFWFCSFAYSPGYAKLKLWEKGVRSFVSSSKIFLKDILAVSNLHNYSLFNSEPNNMRYRKVIISWAKKDNFLEDGSYFDTYFKINSRKIDDSIWFLIYDGKNLPEKIDKNILIFKKLKQGPKYNFLYLINKIVKNIFLYKFSIKKIFYKTSWYTEFSNIVINKIKNVISKDTEIIIMPYEGQPFQNSIFKISKNINKKIKTVGYVHPFPVGLPTNYIKRDGSPEKLIVNGDDQFNCFVKNLSWASNQLKILPSTRFQKDSYIDMAGYIFLPTTIKSKNIIIKSLENFIANYIDEPIAELVVRNHPFKKESKIHLETFEEINKILLKYNNRFSKNHVKKISIFIGSTGSVIEALERGVEVVHVCEDPVFESYSNELWKSIQVKEINKNTFKYKLIEKGNLIKFGADKNIFQDFYLN